ncbi:MAG: tRNA 2-thiouridine(34) synthase MnmA [Phycisphaerales bacterium]|nr:MAG: tRNA 2-thiouridine(34) synthase MnmA [Phycisphaerales bacterium]
MARVLLAMSGGVDSSVAAKLLLDDGHEVVGVFMRLGSPGESLDELTPAEAALACDTSKIRIGKQGCCSVGDSADARAVAAELGIPLYVANFKKDFSRIIDYFVAEYARGRTPNPCVRCNDWLKFGRLHEQAQQLGCDFVASGHYARVVRTETGGHELRRGVDAHKDQTYVLFGVPRAKLAHMLLPVGGYTKPEIRELAERAGLPVFDKPDSQEICFVPDQDYAGLVERRVPGSARTGDVLDSKGNKVGEHGGQHRFTVGQRRGVGVALGYPIYVVEKNPESNTITVGPREALMSRTLVAAEANWLDATDHDAIEEPGEWRPCLAAHRYNHPPQPARVRTLPPGEVPPELAPSGRTGRFEVEFDEDQDAVTPGQAVCLYDGSDPDRVLGGGWIAEAR